MKAPQAAAGGGAVRRPKSKRKGFVITQEQIWLLLFLFPTFIQRFFIGGAGTVATYEELSGSTTVLLGYGLHLLVCLRYLLDARNIGRDPFFMRLFVPLVVVSGLHMLLLLLEPIGPLEALFGILRSLFWILTCVAIVRYAREESFLSLVLFLIHFTFVVIVISWVAYQITGVPYQIIMRGNAPRAQGFLSEPSGMAALLAGYVALAISTRKFMRLPAALVVLFMVNSVIAYVGVLIALVFGAIQMGIKKPSSRIRVKRIFLYTVPVVFVVLALTSGAVSAWATETRAVLSNTSFGDTAIYRNVADRALQAMSTLQYGIDLVRAGENVSAGGLYRYTSIMLLLDDMSKSWRGLTGFGLGAHAQLMVAKDASLLDFGLLPFALSSFGFIGGFLLFAKATATLTASDRDLALFATPFFFVALFNSAGGIHTYSIVVVSCLFLLRNREKVRRGPQISR